MLAEILDRDPESEQERADKALLILDQCSELLKQGEITVTCPCGFTVSILLACRCYFCGIFFCRTCSGRHFSGGPN